MATGDFSHKAMSSISHKAMVSISSISPSPPIIGARNLAADGWALKAVADGERAKPARLLTVVTREAAMLAFANSWRRE